MKLFGLTGSIGMGKSVTAALIKNLGIPVHDSDYTVHQLLAPGGQAFERVALNFPDTWDHNRHIINRSKLAKIVFSDIEARKKLENIIHPLVRESQNLFIKNSQKIGSSAVILDIPLLYETGAEKLCDAVICVTAPYFLQKQRVMRRPGMTEEKFCAILAAQIPDGEKRRRSDVVIHTGLGRAETLRQLKAYFKKEGVIS